MTTGKRLIRMLRQRIETGVYNPGQPLPSGRQLAVEFKADRGTVQRALEVLRQQGMVRQVSPRVTVVSDSTTSTHTLVGQAVAVVALSGRVRPASHRQPGWVEQISLGAFPAIEEAGMHALSFHPARLRDGGLTALIQARPFGVIISDLLDEPFDDALPRRLQQAGIPLVLYGDSPALAMFDRVASDHEQGCYLLTRHLIDRGRRRIACFWRGHGRAPWFQARRRGYERAMAEAGLEPLPIVHHMDAPAPVASKAEFDAAARLALGYLAEHLVGDRPVDALLCSSDGDVPTAAAACRLLHREPGKDIELVGYDHYFHDVPERRFDPVLPPATVDKGNPRLGRELVRLLSDRIAGRLPAAPQCRLVSPQLIDLTISEPAWASQN